MRVTLALWLLLAASPALAQSAAENAFQSAREWTVHIKGSLDTAFIEDEQGSWSGSGMVVDATRGWVLTNAHVASRSFAHLSLSFLKSERLPVTRLYVDPYLDLAVVVYDPKSLATTPPEPVLQCEDLPAVGHPVGAFGHPWGFRFTGTRGITSAVTSRLGPDMLQTDAPINSGNSGGPLISLETGDVLGINSATMSKDRSEGLGFAVPMPLACRVLDLMREGRDPSPPEMLVDFAVDDGGDRTLVVAHSRLPEDSLALQPGDEILAAQGYAVDTQAKLVNVLRGNLDDVMLQVRRGGEEEIVSGRWPAAEPVTERSGVMIAGAMFASAGKLSKKLIAGDPALMVHHVTPGSEAESVDVRAYDLLLAVDGHPVPSLGDLKALTEQARAANRNLETLLIRLVEGDELFVYQRRFLSPDSVQLVGPEPASPKVAAATSLRTLSPQSTKP